MASGELAICLASSSQIPMDIPQSRDSSGGSEGAFISSSGARINTESYDTSDATTANLEGKTSAGGQRVSLPLSSASEIVSDGKRSDPVEKAQNENKSPSTSPKNTKNSKTKEEREAERVRKQQEKQKEKEEKEIARRKRAEEKEQERIKKEEERKQKEQEREQKRAERVAKEQEKENKRKAKEEELERLQKSQLRLRSFFTKKNSESPQKDKAIIKEKETNDLTPESDYIKYFLPFNVKTGLVVAPINQFLSEDGKKLRSRPIETVYAEIESILKGGNNKLEVLPPMKSYFSKKALRKRGKEITLTARDVITRLSSDLTPTEQEYRDMLGSLRCIQLQFAEDIRLPYVGTCTKKCKVPRNNPFFYYPHVDYLVDSEAEWIEDDAEQAEDLADSGDDEEMEDDDVMSVDSFLDDSEDTGRRTHMAPLVPTQLGISWSDPMTGANPIFDSIETRAQVLHPQVNLPIDPFKDYWASTCLSTPSNVQESKLPSKSVGTEIPMISEKDMKAFINNIHGNDGTKGYMIEFLKKEFPHISRKCIRSSLDSISERVGSKTDKRWKVKDELVARYL